MAEGTSLGLAERFWPRVAKSAEPDGCWRWTGAIQRESGRPRVKVNGKMKYAYRVAYELAVGPIPDGLVLDHLCRNPGCVNPAHLEPVPDRVNILRGVSFSAANAAKTHCAKGHEFTPENTRIRPDGGRACRECNKERQRRRWSAKRAARGVNPGLPVIYA